MGSRPMSGYVELTYKYNENKNHAKSSMIAEFIFNLQTILTNRNSSVGHPVEALGSINMVDLLANTNVHVENFLEWDGESRTTPCLNTSCEWLEYFVTFYSSKKIPIWPLPADPGHPRGHCKVCQGVTTGIFRRRDIKVTGGNKVLILN